MPSEGVSRRQLSAVLRQRGRPSVYDQRVADELLSRLATGESLDNICKDEHMPSPPTVRRWAIEMTQDGVGGRASFSADYARARELGYEAIAEGILEFGQEGYRGPDGFVDNGEIQRLRLLSDNRKWLLSKLLPRKYGDKVTQEIVGDGGQPLVTRIELVPVEPVHRRLTKRDDEDDNSA